MSTYSSTKWMMWSVNVAGICGNPAFPEMPRQFRKCLELSEIPQLPGTQTLLREPKSHFFIYSQIRVWQTAKDWPNLFAKPRAGITGLFCLVKWSFGTQYLVRYNRVLLYIKSWKKYVRFNFRNEFKNLFLFKL